MEIGARVKSLREAKGISQKEMEDILGVSHGTYCNRESGLHEIKASNIPKIAETLEVDIKELFEDKKHSRVKTTQRFKESTVNGAVIILADKKSTDRLVEVLKNNL